MTLFVTSDAIAEACRPWQDILAVRLVSLPDEMTDAWLLVRPDGYLAAAGRAGDARRLTRWLDRWLIRPAP